jgi:hypothetical protein
VGRRTNPWIAALALAARLAVWLTPARGADVARARALGIVSVSILAGHSKSAESLAYFAALACGIAAGAAVWRLLAGPVALARRPLRSPSAHSRSRSSRSGSTPCSAAPGGCRSRATACGPVLAEEGEMWPGSTWFGHGVESRR